MVPELYLWIKELGGYFRRFKGGVLAPWIHASENPPKFDLEARATAAFFEVSTISGLSRKETLHRFKVDRQLSSDKVAQACGATASVVILQPLDTPAAPFFSAEQVALTVAHCGSVHIPSGSDFRSNLWFSTGIHVFFYAQRMVERLLR
jgi:protein phosphatase PTC6